MDIFYTLILGFSLVMRQVTFHSLNFTIISGKGLAFETNVPFKLLNDYVEVLGGTKSDLFNNFRRLFFK